MNARQLVLALAFCGCGGRTSLDSSVQVEAATADSTAIIADASATDVDDVDGPQLIGPDLDATHDASLVDACINPFDRDSSAMCVTMADCCQVAIGTACYGGQCIPLHPQ